MIDSIVAIALAALISGAIGYVAAVTRSGTRIALLERDTADNKARWNDCQKELHVIAEDNQHRLALLLRLVIDIARKSGVELRTADVLEITSLGPTETR